MIPRLEGWSLILAGFWNRAIFLPEWALPQLFPQHELPEHAVQTEVALLAALPLIYRDSQVAVEISGGFLTFRPLVSSDEALLRCERMARKMLLELPRTPVHATGINFSFRESMPPDRIAFMFASMDEATFEQQGWAIRERKVTRKLVQGDDTLNLVITLANDAVDFDFNFHTDCGGDSEAAALAMEEGRVLRLRETAKNLLRDTYHLVIEGENVVGND